MTHPPARKRLTSLLIRLGVAAAILWVLFANHASLQEVGRLLKQANPRWIAFALFLAVAGEVLTAYKWRVLLATVGSRLPIIKAIHVSFIGMFYNNFFPGSVGGDIIRTLLISREAGGKARAAASIFMQRNTGLAALFLAGLPAAYLYPMTWDYPGQWVSRITDAAPILSAPTPWFVLAGIGFAVVNIALFSPRLARLWNLVQRRLPSPHTAHDTPHNAPSHDTPHSALSENDQARITTQSTFRRILTTLFEKLERFHRELHGYRFFLPTPLILSIFTQLIDVAAVYAITHAIGHPLPYGTLIPIVSFITLASLAPVTFNGLGMREALYIGLLATHGISPSVAVSISLMKFALTTLIALYGGLLHLRTR